MWLTDYQQMLKNLTENRPTYSDAEASKDATK